MHKQHQLILLPADKAKLLSRARMEEHNILLIKGDKTNSLNYKHDWIYNLEQYYTPQNLYVLSDEPPKDGDWVCCLSETDPTVLNWKINQCIFQYKSTDTCRNDKKIIATTDTSLTHFVRHSDCNGLGCDGCLKHPLPMLKLPFILKYSVDFNLGIKVNEVNVEYEDVFNDVANECFEDIIPPKVWKLKVNSENLINIEIKLHEKYIHKT